MAFLHGLSPVLLHQNNRKFMPDTQKEANSDVLENWRLMFEKWINKLANKVEHSRILLYVFFVHEAAWSLQEWQLCFWWGLSVPAWHAECAQFLQLFPKHGFLKYQLLAEFNNMLVFRAMKAVHLLLSLTVI